MLGDDVPSVTIGITAFNCEDTLQSAVASALEQDYPNIDILIVDDCSTDESFSIAKELARSNNKIRAIRAPKNAGVAASRNLIINNTTGDFIIFFDDDDTSNPARVRKQLKRIQSGEDGDRSKLVICHTARIVRYGEVLSRYEKCLAQDAGTKGVTGSAVSEAILNGTRDIALKGACPACSLMARTQTFKRMKGFDENLRRSEDTEFCIRAAEQGATFVGVRQPLVHQIMTQGEDKNLSIEKQNWLYVLNKHRAVIERGGEHHFAVAWLDLRFIFTKGKYLHFIVALAMLAITSPQQTFRRLYCALPNIAQHSAMSGFTKKNAHRDSS